MEIEKGLIGLRVELRKIEEEIHTKISKHWVDFEETRDDFIKFQGEVHESFIVTKEEMHRRYTEFKAHINEILLEYKESILLIQSYVDNQLVINKRDRTDINMLLDNLIEKSKFHDKVSIHKSVCTKFLQNLQIPNPVL